MDEIDEYIANLTSSISNSNEPDYFKSYLIGQLHISQGNYEEAVKLLSSAFDKILQLKNSQSNHVRREAGHLESSSSSKKRVDIQKNHNETVKTHESFNISDISRYSHLFSTIGALLATSYEYLGDFDRAEDYFLMILKDDPSGLHIGDYAVFLHRRKKEYEKANSFYLKSLELYPDQSTIRLKYAGFLRHIKKDNPSAAIQYQLSIESNPNNSDALGNYASFLHGVMSDMKKAEEYYEAAYQVDSLHANNLCNYGLFLSEEKRDYTRAEVLYRRVLEVSGEHANTLYNYGVMLDTHCMRKPEAEDLYRRTIAIEPNHAYGLYNLAVLLEEKLSSLKSSSTSSSSEDDIIYQDRFTEVESLYRRAIGVDSNDATTMADYGRFLLMKMEDIVNAENILNKSIRIDDKCEVGLFHLGILHARYKQASSSKAEECFRIVLSKNHVHIGCLHHLARLLMDDFLKDVKANSMRKDEIFAEVMDLYEKAITATAETSILLTDYINTAIKHGSISHKIRCARFAPDAIRKLTMTHPSTNILSLEAALSNLQVTEK